jgi:exopolyphosphatase / guanosine-5'-triphosphate,3'-diphosphate pyrophosphatase
LARFAAIDIGSNAIRLRIVDVEREDRDGLAFKEVVSQRAAVRLGTEVFFTHELPVSAISQTCDTLKDFRKAMDLARVDAYRATATSAVREAKNRALLVERAEREAGISLDIIEGVEEARLVRVAVARRLNLVGETALLIDVGGGSSEFTLLQKGEHIASLSLPLGSVRLLETYLRDTKVPEKKRLNLVDEEIDRGISEVRRHTQNPKITALVGTGGNVDTLAELCPTEGLLPGERAIDVAKMGALVDELLTLSTEERKERYKLRADRADTIVPAARVFLRAAAKFKQTRILAPGVGLKEGILLDLVERHFGTGYDARETEAALEGCLRLGRRYQFDEAHGLLVSQFGALIFDALQKHHNLSPRKRVLLKAACILHDIGDYVRYDGHHKHSYYIIRNSDIVGLSRDERMVVANIARYHRRGPPDVAHEGFRSLSKEQRADVRALVAMVRVADALDREHLGSVRQIAPSVDQKTLRLNLEANQDYALEEWNVRAKSDLLREVFGLAVE